MVACAKATNGRACSPQRPLWLAGYTPEVRAAVAQVVALMPEALSAYLEWTRLRDALAERLARACVRVGVRRLSLYSFRHAALATWKAAGLDPPVIAALAGHKTSAMQGRYAGARHGWDARDGLPEPDPELVAEIAARSTSPRIQNAIATTVETPSSGSRQSMEIPTSSAQADEVGRIDDTSDPASLRAGDIEVTTVDDVLSDPVRSSAPAEPLGEQFGCDADLFPSFPTPPQAPSPPRMPRLSAVELFRHFSYSARLDPRPVTTIPGLKPDNYDEPSMK